MGGNGRRPVGSAPSVPSAWSPRACTTPFRSTSATGVRAGSVRSVAPSPPARYLCGTTMVTAAALWARFFRLAADASPGTAIARDATQAATTEMLRRREGFIGPPSAKRPDFSSLGDDQEEVRPVLGGAEPEPLVEVDRPVVGDGRDEDRVVAGREPLERVLEQPPRVALAPVRLERRHVLDLRQPLVRVDD